VDIVEGLRDAARQLRARDKALGAVRAAIDLDFAAATTA
jgi:hypothetical protein